MLKTPRFVLFELKTAGYLMFIYIIEGKNIEYDFFSNKIIAQFTSCWVDLLKLVYNMSTHYIF